MTPVSKSRQPNKATKAIIQRRLQQAAECLSAGWRHGQVVNALKTEYGIGTKAAEKVITRVYREWRKVNKKSRKTTRAAQLQRLYRLLEADNEKTKSLTKLERIRLETLIAKIEGNLAPIEVGGAAEAEPIRVVLEDYRSPTPATEESK